MTRIGAYTFLVAGLALFGTSATAENVVKLHASYLDAPTPWCSADEGVPIAITMDGPDVGGTLASKFYVTQLRGTERRQVEIPPPEGYSEPTSAYTGRFGARMEICDNFWKSNPADVEWQVVDGAEVLDSGTYESTYGISRAVPLFRQGYGTDDFVLRLPDKRRLIAKGPIATKGTIEAFASPVKEQSQ